MDRLQHSARRSGSCLHHFVSGRKSAAQNKSARASRGCELQAEGRDSVDDKGPKHDEFRKIDKQLNWYLLQQHVHAMSVFDDMLDRKQPPSYLRRYASGGPDWYESQRLRRVCRRSWSTGSGSSERRDPL